jgi:hypothetical protein
MAVILLGVVARTHVMDRGIAPSVLIFAMVLLLICFVTILNVTFAKVTLYPDRIERTSWFGKKSLLLADVASLERRGKYKVPILISKNGLFDSVQLPTGVKEDAAWKAWMAVANSDDAAHVDASQTGGRTRGS